MRVGVIAFFLSSQIFTAHANPVDDSTDAIFRSIAASPHPPGTPSAIFFRENQLFIRAAVRSLVTYLETHKEALIAHGPRLYPAGTILRFAPGPGFTLPMTIELLYTNPYQLLLHLKKIQIRRVDQVLNYKIPMIAKGSVKTGYPSLIYQSFEQPIITLRGKIPFLDHKLSVEEQPDFINALVESEIHYAAAEGDPEGIAPSPTLPALYYTRTGKAKYTTSVIRQRGDLRRYLKPPNPPTLATNVLEIEAFRLLLALDHLEQQGIIHRDLKPENILEGDDGFLITDFSFANVIQRDDTPRSLRGPAFGGKSDCTVGTSTYAPPEAALAAVRVRSLYAKLKIHPERQAEYDQALLDRQDQLTNQKYDIWSLGIILAELRLRTPFYPRLLEQIDRRYDTPEFRDIGVHLLLATIGHYDKIQEIYGIPIGEIRPSPEEDPLGYLIHGILNPNPLERWSPAKALARYTKALRLRNLKREAAAARSLPTPLLPPLTPLRHAPDGDGRRF